jgi:hypothetical protein
MAWDVQGLLYNLGPALPAMLCKEPVHKFGSHPMQLACTMLL